MRIAKVRGVHKTTKTQAGMRQVTMQPEALAPLLDQQPLNGAADIVFHNPRTNQPWHNDQAIRKTAWPPGRATGQRKYRTPSKPVTPSPPCCYHAEKPPMGRRAI